LLEIAAFPSSCLKQSYSSSLHLSDLNSITIFKTSNHQSNSSKIQHTKSLAAGLAEMCFLFSLKPKKCSRGSSSSSSSSSRKHSKHPFSHHASYEKERAREYERFNHQAYERVISNFDQNEGLKKKFGYGAASNSIPTTKQDVEKAIAAALAKDAKERKDRENQALLDKLAEESRARHKREERETPDSSFQALTKFIDDERKERKEERKQREEKEKWGREKKEWKDEVSKELMAQMSGPASHVSHNSSAYGNNGLQASSRQGLLAGVSVDDIAEWQKRLENKVDNRLRTYEDDNDFILSRQSRRLNYS
jgi:hypothetical protein